MPIPILEHDEPNPIDSGLPMSVGDGWTIYQIPEVTVTRSIVKARKTNILEMRGSS
jgi:hypothetical protein